LVKISFSAWDIEETATFTHKVLKSPDFLHNFKVFVQSIERDSVWIVGSRLLCEHQSIQGAMPWQCRFPKHLVMTIIGPSSETTLNYWMMVDRYSNLKEEVGDSIPACEISSLRDRKLAKWSTASCALVLACRPLVSKKTIIGHIFATLSI
jgi:hypothetical protein